VPDNDEHGQQAQKMEALGTMASGIAHDFNNILQGLYNSLFDLEDSLKTNPSALEKLDVTYQLADQAKELVKQILTYSRHQEGHYKAFSPVSAIQDVVEIMKSHNRLAIPVHLEIDAPQIKINGDETQIKQVFLNLITNAFHAMENTKKPLLKIIVSQKMLPHNQRSYLCVDIIDNGHGLMKHHKNRIYEPFFTTKNVGEGSGLGLSVVHGIVAKHGGTVDVVSDPVEHYTKFKIRLPLVIKDEKGLSYKNLIYNGTEDILLVAPKLKTYIEFTSILDELGHQVTHYDDTNQAYSFVKNRKHIKNFALILDRDLPNMHTIELVRKLRQFHPNIAVLVIQGRTAKRDKANLPESLFVIPIDYEMIQYNKRQLKKFLHSFTLP
jgi:CheY-like chemotaxis protein